MGLVRWYRRLLGGFILVLVLLSLSVSFTGYLIATHQTCASSSSLSSSSSSAVAPAAPFSPVQIADSDLILSPLADLSLTASHGNNSAIADLTDSAYWKDVGASELQTYRQLLPQTVLGFFNSSQEWRDWALQNIPNAPIWVSVGLVPYSQGQVNALEPAFGGTGNSTAVALGIQGFAASAAGLDLAALDFLTFNGLTALRVLFETKNPTLAACQTLPGQLAQLYTSASDPNVPRDLRAQYLGRALAITSVMLLVGGKDGFSVKFGTALNDLRLAVAWSTVKPYLGDIGTKVSAGASSATFAILQTLAKRFPQNSAFVTGFTADRIDSMVDVLYEKGTPDSTIQSDISRIAQAAGTSSDDKAAGEAADLDSILQGGGMQVYVRSGNKMVLYDDGTGVTATIRGTFLQKILPGFDPRGPGFVQIHYRGAGVTAYHYYPQKVALGASYGPEDTNWLPVAPRGIASPGDVITISFDLLTTDDFLRSVPLIKYANFNHIGWVADSSKVTGFRLTGNQIGIGIQQETFDGISNFEVLGNPTPLANVGGDTFVQFSVADVVNAPDILKITFNGYGNPVLSIESGTNFNPITLVSNDGAKLKFVYDSGGNSVAVSTTYLRQPSDLWNLPSISGQDFGFAVKGAARTFKLNGVTPTRGLEKEMVNSGSKYDLARVGAEIAYTVCQQEFGVEDIQLNEPSQGGADLISGDKHVTIQARMLGFPSALSPTNLESTLNFEMNDLAGQVKDDFSKNPSATTGYAVLSYLDPTTKTLVTLVAEIPKP